MAFYVVTGASSGIGRAIAEGLVLAGHNVFGTIRRAADGERLEAELGPLFRTIEADVTDSHALSAAAQTVSSCLGDAPLAGLVNNAGIAFSGPLLEQSLDAVEAHLAVNLLGPLKVTRAFVPLIARSGAGQNPKGRIVNISSAAGRFGAPFLGAYSASKHGLEGLSSSLRRELLALGIDVIVVAPGAVSTPIWDKAESRSRIEGADAEISMWTEPLHRFERAMLRRGRNGLKPQAVADVVLEALTCRRPRWRYAVGSSASAAAVFSSILPTRLQDRLLARSLGLLPQGSASPQS
jgi:NAD(P)-dependent dehydrogenase (short-subunit alcohol dehydrogenase family)